MLTSVKMLSSLVGETQTEPDIEYHPEEPAYLGPITDTIEFTTSRAFEPGDVITLTFSNAYDGTYRMNERRVFEKIA